MSPVQNRQRVLRIEFHNFSSSADRFVEPFTSTRRTARGPDGDGQIGPEFQGLVDVGQGLALSPSPENTLARTSSTATLPESIAWARFKSIQKRLRVLLPRADLRPLHERLDESGLSRELCRGRPRPRRNLFSRVSTVALTS